MFFDAVCLDYNDFRVLLRWLASLMYVLYFPVVLCFQVQAQDITGKLLSLLRKFFDFPGKFEFLPLPTSHRQGAGISDSATRPSAVFEDEVVLKEFELTPRAYPARPALQTPPPVQPPSRAQPMADPARSRPSPLSLPHAAVRSAQDPDKPPSPGLHAPSPLNAADNAATAAAAGSSRA